MSTLKKPLRTKHMEGANELVDANNWAIAEVDKGNGLCEQIVRELNAYDALLAACEAVIPWVALMTSDHDPYRHPQSVANAKADLEQLLAAISAAKPEPAKEQA